MPAALLPLEMTVPRVEARLRRRPALIRLRRPLLVFDLRDHSVHWIRFVPGGRGPLVEDMGVAVSPGEDPVTVAAAIALRRPNRRARVVTVMRSGEMQHRRFDLPPMTRREADTVMRRRAAELVRELGAGVVAAPLGTGGGGTRWLCAAPRDLCEDMSRRFRQAQVELGVLASRQLALGSLVRGFSHPAGGALTALVDFGAESVTCAVADAAGWCFGREISLKFAGERLMQTEAEQENEGEPHAAALSQVERVATELRRTFDYVQRQRGLGAVSRVVLAGSSDELSTLATMLGMYLDLPIGVLGEEIGEGPLSGVHPGSAGAWGVVLSSDPGGGNLLPDTVLRPSRERAARRRLVATAATVGVVGAAFGGLLYERIGAVWGQTSVLQQRLDAVAQERAAVEAAKATRERVAENKAALAPADRPEPDLGALVQALGRVAPPDLFVDAVSVRIEGDLWRFAFQVSAVDPDVTTAARAISDLVDALGGSPFLAIDRSMQEERAAGEASAIPVPGLRYRLEGRLAPVLRTERVASGNTATELAPTPPPPPPAGDARG